MNFNDICEITNYSGRYDEYDNPIGDVIYKGSCMYQSGNQADKDILVRRDKVYILGINRNISANDTIVIRTKLGEKIKGVINEAFPIEMPLSGTRYTKIEVTKSIEE